MKRLLLALTVITLPSIASAQIAIQNDYAIQGKIFAVKRPHGKPINKAGKK